jgi:hypothetical protein
LSERALVRRHQPSGAEELDEDLKLLESIRERLKEIEEETEKRKKTQSHIDNHTPAPESRNDEASQGHPKRQRLESSSPASSKGSDVCENSHAETHRDETTFTWVHHEDVDRSPYRYMEFAAAAKNGDEATVERLIPAVIGARCRDWLMWGPLIDSRRCGGSTALHMAARNGHLGVVQRLIAARAGLDVDFDSEFGSGFHTALHLASEYGHTRVTAALLAAGATEAGCWGDTDDTPRARAEQAGRLAEYDAAVAQVPQLRQALAELARIESSGNDVEKELLVDAKSRNPNIASTELLSIFKAYVRLEVLIAVMLARERRLTADAASAGCTPLALALAALPSRPLEMVADAVAALGCADVLPERLRALLRGL